MKFKLSLAILSLSTLLNAQTTGSSSNQDSRINKRGCGTLVPSAEWDAWFNQKVKEYKEKQVSGKVQSTTITIPVIVHVIHGGQTVGTFPNISQNQINSQISVLNKDFGGIGLNTFKLAATGFSAVGVANTNVSFCLAQFDPNGTPLTEPGIDRINFNTNSWTNPNVPTTSSAFQNLMDNTIKPNSIWDPTYYFNIWVSDVNSGAQLLGYATFPAATSLSGLPSAGNSTNDGIWVWARSFGNTGTLDFTYNKGRTATHETGHWLGLRHIGGDGNFNPSGDCNATDYCDDTPPQKGGFGSGQYGQNFGNPTYPLHANACAPNDPYGDMFMNFMDYVDDPWCYMFTPDQNTRIQTALAEGVYRNQLSASATTLCVGLPDAGFILPAQACVNENIALTNQTTGSAVLSYSWTSNPVTGSSFAPTNTDAHPSLSFTAAGSYTVNVVASNNIGVTSYSAVIDVSDCTGIQTSSLFDREIHLFPNPSNGMVSIHSNLIKNQSIQVDVYNSLGELLLHKNTLVQNSENIDLNLSEFANGVYSVRISNGAEKASRRLIINR